MADPKNDNPIMAAALKILVFFWLSSVLDWDRNFLTTSHFNSVESDMLAVCGKIGANMPLTKSAIKKLRSDKKKASFNRATKTKAKSAIDTFKSLLNLDSLSKAFSAVDKAAKKGVLKEGKANRIKSRLSKKIK